MVWHSLARVLGRPFSIANRELALTVVPEVRDAIVVLGATLGPGDTVTPILAERIAVRRDVVRRRCGAADRHHRWQ